MLVPRQHVLRAIDPDGSKTAEQLRDEILLLAKDYQNIVIRRALPDTMDVAEALRIYSYFHWVSPASSWGVTLRFHALDRTATRTMHASTQRCSPPCTMLIFSSLML